MIEENFELEGIEQNEMEKKEKKVQEDGDTTNKENKEQVNVNKEGEEEEPPKQDLATTTTKKKKHHPKPEKQHKRSVKEEKKHEKEKEDKEKDTAEYDPDEQELTSSYINQEIRFYKHKIKDLSAKLDKGSESTDEREVLKFKLKMVEQKLKLFKEMRHKVTNNIRPLKPTIDHHIKLSVKEHDFIESLLKSDVTPKTAHRYQERAGKVKQTINHYLYLKKVAKDGAPLKTHIRTYDKNEYFGRRETEESIIELKEAKDIPDEVVYHYYTPNEKGDWDHKIIPGVKAFKKEDRIVVHKYRDPRKHTVIDVDEGERSRRLQRRRQRNVDDIVDDRYVYYDGMKTVHRKVTDRYVEDSSDARSGGRRKRDTGNIIIQNIYY